MGNWVAWKFDYLVGKFKKNVMEMLCLFLFFLRVIFYLDNYVDVHWMKCFFEKQAQVVKVLIHPEWLIEPLCSPPKFPWQT